MQKEINQLSGKLDRTFAVTDELIFRVCFFTFLYFWNVEFFFLIFSGIVVLAEEILACVVF